MLVNCCTLFPMNEIDKEVQRFARLLESVVLVSRVPARQIERRLDYGAGTLNRVFNGRIGLKMRHILAVLEVIGMDGETFFKLAYRKEEGDALAAQILAALKSQGFGPTGLRPQAALSEEELEERILSVVERVFASRGAGGEPPRREAAAPRRPKRGLKA